MSGVIVPCPEVGQAIGVTRLAGPSEAGLPAARAEIQITIRVKGLRQHRRAGAVHELAGRAESIVQVV